MRICIFSSFLFCLGLSALCTAQTLKIMWNWFIVGFFGSCFHIQMAFYFRSAIVQSWEPKWFINGKRNNWMNVSQRGFSWQSLRTTVEWNIPKINLQIVSYSENFRKKNFARKENCLLLQEFRQMILSYSIPNARYFRFTDIERRRSMRFGTFWRCNANGVTG